VGEVTMREAKYRVVDKISKDIQIGIVRFNPEQYKDWIDFFFSIKKEIAESKEIPYECLALEELEVLPEWSTIQNPS
jgi:hypothetical protein